MGVYGLLVLTLNTLPLEIILATPLRYLVANRVADSLRLGTEVTQLDDFWREIDEFASVRGLRWLPTRSGIKRVFDEYNSEVGYSVDVQVAPDGKPEVSFFSLPPKGAALAPIVSDFKRRLANYHFESWVDPNDVASPASAR